MANLGGLAISAGIPLGIGALLRLFQYLIEKATPRRSGESRLPSYVAATGLLCGVAAGFILAAGLLGHMSPRRDDYGAWIALLFCSSAAAVWLIVAAGNWRMWQSAAGIQIRSMLGLTKPIHAWGSIERVRPANGTGMMVFQLRGGGVFKVPFHTAGLLEAVKTAQVHGATLDDGLAAQLAQARSSDQSSL